MVPLEYRAYRGSPAIPLRLGPVRKVQMKKCFGVLALILFVCSISQAQTWDFSSADQIETNALPNPSTIGSNKWYVTSVPSADTFRVESNKLNIATRLASLQSALAFQEPYTLFKTFAPTNSFCIEAQLKFDIISPGQAVALVLLDPTNAIGPHFISTAFWIGAADGPGFATLGGQAVTRTVEQGAKWDADGDGASPGFSGDNVLRLRIEKNGDELRAFASNDDGATWIARGDTTWVDTVTNFGSTYFVAMLVAVNPQNLGATTAVPSTNVTVQRIEISTPTSVPDTGTVKPKKWVDIKRLMR
jgi:hypothetical protein